MSQQHPRLDSDTRIDPDDIGHNESDGPAFNTILEARLSRRSVLRGGFGTAATLFIGSTGLAGCNSSSSEPDIAFNFNAIAKSLADTVTVPEGFRATVIYACGDPLNAATAAFRNDGSDASFEARAGDQHDGMNYFGLNAAGTARDLNGNDRGILAMNHENIVQIFLHTNGGTNTTKGGPARPASEVDKEIAAHGLSFVEVQKVNGAFQVNRNSAYNRRITPNTPAVINGPVRGSDLVKTKFDANGINCRGTINNCATGYTPWGTFLTCEENWANYFHIPKGDFAKRSAAELASLRRYGFVEEQEGGFGNEYRWFSAGSEDQYARWNIGVAGASASADYRNEPNTYGYVLEVDPYDARSTPRKRTHLGRFAHECAVYPAPVAGKPIVFYMGDDSRNEYIYKYVSKALWDAADANRGMAAGDKYLDEGTLYVAKFNADGTGTWIALTPTNAQIAAFSSYPLRTLADIMVHTRLAADAVGATKMDRPEWCDVNPKNGEVYFTLTNNSNRVVASPTGSQLLPDAANPRAYEDPKGTATQRGNVNGHVIRTAEIGSDPASLTFRWDVYLFASEAGANANINLSSLTAENDMSSPDGLWFSKATGLMWLQTDDGAYTDVTNCMMLAAIPGQVGDGGVTTVSNTIGTSKLDVVTVKGKNPTPDTLRRFLVGPKGCEVTGVTETPDGKTLFVNIQHPGENTTKANLGNPSLYESHWPDGGNARPRSATLVITKNDGGRIGTA